MILVDSSVWSLALRRNPALLNPNEKAVVDAWTDLADTGCAGIVGIVRQEVLCGVSDNDRFERLRLRLSDMPLLSTGIDEHDLAAHLFNVCRSRGITTSTADILICASARFHRLPLFTVDTDFARIAPLVDIDLWRVENRS